MLVIGLCLSSFADRNAASAAEPPLVVGREKQLFFDDLLIASSKNITRRIHQAQKSPSNPLIRQTEAWEDPFNIMYGSVVRDGEKFKAWYLSGAGTASAMPRATMACAGTNRRSTTW
jgi:hypothetical protein